nr:hypothetical protein [uncultured Acetobacterium sp.]
MTWGRFVRDIYLLSVFHPILSYNGWCDTNRAAGRAEFSKNTYVLIKSLKMAVTMAVTTTRRNTPYGTDIIQTGM